MKRVIGAGVSSGLLAGLAASVVVALTPRVRGLGYAPELRLAIIIPACVLLGVVAAVTYDRLERRASPLRLLAVLAGSSLLLLLGIASAGPAGLARQAWPALAIVSLMLAWQVPRALSRPRSRWGKVGLLLVGGLEVAAVVGALVSERRPPPDASGVAFEIPRRMFDVQHRFLELEGGARVHYIDEGAGPTLLFLHGNPAWSFQWRDLIAGLRGQYRCIALDYPGFGLSVAPAGFDVSPREQSRVVEELVRRLELRNVTLVMQDWGGPIGLGFAGRRPELVSGVVLGSTWAWPTTTSEPRGKFSVIAGGPIGELVQMNFNGFAKLGIQNGIVRDLPTDVLEVYLHPFRPLNRRGIAAYYPGQINAATAYFEEVEAGLKRLRDKRALIFWALKDAGFPRADLRRFQSAFPLQQTIELPSADHFFFEDNAELMIARIAEFMNHR